MIIQVDGILKAKHEHFSSLIEACPEPKFVRSEKKPRIPTSMLFECEDGSPFEQVKSVIKKIIKSDLTGAILSFRVVEEGKPF